MKNFKVLFLVSLFFLLTFTSLLIAEEVVRELKNPDFETGDLTGWTVVEGDAFSDANITDLDQGSWFEELKFMHSEDYHLWGFIMDLDEEGNPIYEKGGRNGDAQTGILRSNKFILSGTGEISFLIGGGSDLDNLYVALVRASDQRILKKATGPNIETYSRVWWNASEFLGEEVYIEVVDKATGGMGHLNIDDFNVYHQDRASVIRNLENSGFETGDLTGWKVVEGNAFEIDDQYPVPEGKYHTNTASDRTKTGIIESNIFQLDGTGEITFYIKSNRYNDPNLYVALIRESDDEVLFKSHGDGSGAYIREKWDAFNYLGEEVYIKIVDNSERGYLAVDGFEVYQQGLIAHWPLEEDTDTIARYKTSGPDVKLEPKAIDYARGLKDDINYVFNNAKYKPSTPPLWRKGVVGNALLFDGYSTWISRTADQIARPKEELTIETWVSPRSYEWGDGGQMSAIVNQHNKFKMTGYILGMGRHGRWSLQVGTGRRWIELWADEDKPLEKNQWSHIAAVYNSSEDIMRLYLNGEIVGQKELNGESIAPAEERLIIARHNQAINIGPFAVNMFSGMIDELKIHNQALTAEEISANYKKIINKFDGVLPEPDLIIDRSVYAGDRYRPQYHLITASHWMNEPHAPMYYNPDSENNQERYHIFYQHNPHGPYWHQIHWGHAVSKDMVHWEEMPIAIAPQEPVTPDGVWSGDTVLDDDGNPLIFYTAGDDERGKSENKTNQNIAIARPDDLGDDKLKDWIVDDRPVIEQSREIANMNALSFEHFRDPFVWRDSLTGDYYMLVGTGLIGQLGGTSVLFRANDSDLEEWETIGNFHQGSYQENPLPGHVWELPVLLPLRDQFGNETEKYIFLINPWFATDSPYAVKFVPYWIGNLDRDSEGIIRGFEPDHQEPKLFDYGENFTGPSGFVAPDGRSILFSIAQGKRTPKQHYDSGWAHNGGLPLNLYLELRDDDQYRLKINPIKELESLRQEKLISLKNKTVAEVNRLLDKIDGDLLEIKVEFASSQLEEYGIKVRRSPDGQEETLIYYNDQEKTININRDKSTHLNDVARGIQGGEIDLEDENLSLHIFLDRSMVEVYANEIKSLTSRVYPTRADSLGLKLFAEDEGLIIKSMEVWKMGSAYTEDGSVEPAYYGN